ncbi:MAG: hypothetical protein M1823_005420 [Watsoniomyces obsoletus]|nr:MAG: hypothetical protein M1823_005420 [Watsoniomyces obsoletus]
MNLSDLVHANRRDSRPPQPFSPQSSPEDTPRSDMSPTLTAAPCQIMSANFSASRGIPPPSPPMDDLRCSLPSISDLFQSADRGSAQKPERGGDRPRARTIPSHSYPEGFHGHPHQQPPHVAGRELSRSPSASSQHSSTSGPVHHAGPPPSAYPTSGPSIRLPLLPSTNPFGPPPPQHPGPGHPPPTDPMGRPLDWYQHPPLYQPYAPHGPPGVLGNAALGMPGTNPLQHHHYSPSSQAGFPPSQDRYICQTCSKAFSRPSSLRIHSHSHTGEKPFKCPHEGCGKAFSVRSNMKRHERGCHARSPPSM